MKAVTFLIMTLPLGGMAQVSQGGLPVGWGTPVDHFGATPILTITPAMVAADSGAPELDHPGVYRFGEQRWCAVNILAQGRWEDMPGGGRVCRLSLASPGAVMLSVQFDAFHLPEGASMFLFGAGRTTYLGGFTAANHQPTGDFATALLPGDTLTIEYQQPAGASGAQLHVASITHAWASPFSHRSQADRDFDPGYPSSPCHTNVVCPVAADWQEQNRSVVWFVEPSGVTCNGTLLNNTAQDGTPYVIIAHHCYQPTESQWIFYFNYQSPTCTGDTGQTYQSVLGAANRAASYQGDFNLLELNNIPAAYNAYYAGWDRSGDPPQSGAMFLNPLSDVEKICFSNDTATSAIIPEMGTACWQHYWFSGILEAGGSGAPLFDRDKHFVGHTVDGIMTCETASSTPTLASKFSANWDGSAPAFRLRDWLDPLNNGATVLGGFDPNGAETYVTVRPKMMLAGPFNSATSLMATGLNDNGLLPLTEPYSAMGYQHHGAGGGEGTSDAVLALQGASRVVDWVVVELRNNTAPAQVQASRAALLHANGTVTGVDGISDVIFRGTPAGNYYVAVRHRNHLGAMTAEPVALTRASTSLDLTNGTIPLMGGSTATRLIGGTHCLWAGDLNMDGAVSYTGAGNDRDPVLVRVGSSMPTDTFNGYALEDANLDGTVMYTGTDNDRDIILQTVGSMPTNVRHDALP